MEKEEKELTIWAIIGVYLSIIVSAYIIIGLFLFVGTKILDFNEGGLIEMACSSRIQSCIVNDYNEVEGISIKINWTE